LIKKTIILPTYPINILCVKTFGKSLPTYPILKIYVTGNRHIILFCLTANFFQILWEHTLGEYHQLFFSEFGPGGPKIGQIADFAIKGLYLKNSSVTFSPL